MNGTIWKYDGISWNKIAELKKEGTDLITFENIWGESADDFYAVGNGPNENLYANVSVIAHYQNDKWEMVDTQNLIGNIVHLYKNKSDGKIYLRLTHIGGAESSDSTKIYEYIAGKFNLLYCSLETKGLQADITLINSKVFFILGNTIATRTDNEFQIVLSVDNSNFYQRIWGRSSKDIFLLMTDGLAHYNGSDIEYLFHFNLADKIPWTQIYGAALYEKEVFFITYEPPTGLKLIYHGKLKE